METEQPSLLPTRILAFKTHLIAALLSQHGEVVKTSTESEKKLQQLEKSLEWCEAYYHKVKSSQHSTYTSDDLEQLEKQVEASRNTAQKWKTFVDVARGQVVASGQVIRIAVDQLKRSFPECIAASDELHEQQTEDCSEHADVSDEMQNHQIDFDLSAVQEEFEKFKLD
ncbi:hypothetical protein GGR57DRAFT_506223 [Xylariaceae sp. FL1272]|nr:hypothetical protein GGR57DRAFT_506223 [Xylariaceae sp. FL1272]